LDGTDAVMLSAETAIGDYPVETVLAMDEVCKGAETYHQTISGKDEFEYSELQYVDHAIALSSMSIARNMDIKAIVTLTESGSTALMLSRVRSEIPIYAFTRNLDTQRRVALYRGVISYPYLFNVDNMVDVIKEIRKELLSSNLANAGDLIIITSGLPLKVSGGTNSLRIIKI
jgi:pyruvate kinase